MQDDPIASNHESVTFLPTRLYAIVTLKERGPVKLTAKVPVSSPETVPVSDPVAAASLLPTIAADAETSALTMLVPKANFEYAIAAEVETSALTIDVARLSFEYAIAAELEMLAFAILVRVLVVASIDLFVKTSVVALPTSVSVAAGIVKVLLPVVGGCIVVVPATLFGMPKPLPAPIVMAEPMRFASVMVGMLLRTTLPVPVDVLQDRTPLVVAARYEPLTPVGAVLGSVMVVLLVIAVGTLIST